MSKVWIKIHGLYNGYRICGSYVFGSIEAVNKDKMTHANEATQFVKHCLEKVQKTLNKTENEKLTYHLVLDDIQLKLKEDKEKGIKNKENRKRNKEVETALCRYNDEIRKLKDKITIYQHALENPLEAIDIWMKEYNYEYEEYELIP